MIAGGVAKRVKDPTHLKATPMPMESLNVSFLELKDDQCRSVEGRGDDGLAVYCGHSQKPGSSYCPFHSSVYELVYEIPKKPNIYRVPGREA